MVKTDKTILIFKKRTSSQKEKEIKPQYMSYEKRVRDKKYLIFIYKREAQFSLQQLSELT